MVLKSIDNSPQLIKIPEFAFNKRILGLSTDFEDKLEQWAYRGNVALATFLRRVEKPDSIIYAIDVNIDNLSFTFNDIDGKPVHVSLKHGMDIEGFPIIILNRESITKEYECDLFRSEETLFLNLARYTLNNGSSKLTRDLSNYNCHMRLAQVEYSAKIDISGYAKATMDHAHYTLPNEEELIENLMASIQLPVSAEELYKLIEEITGMDLDESSITITVSRINAEHNREEMINMLSLSNGFLETYEKLIMLPSGKIYRLTAYRNGEFQISCVNLSTEECEGYQLDGEAQKRINDEIKAIKKIGRFKPKKDQS